MSIEAKDLYNAMIIPQNKEGYCVRDKDGNYILRKFINTLDDSLCTRKLKEVFGSTVRHKKFSFKVGKHHYCPYVINVKFSYSFKEWNLVWTNTYVKAGYNIHELKFEDGACLVDGQLVAIQTDVKINNPLPQSILGKYFAYKDGCYRRVKNIRTLMNRADLRKHLYKFGFVCDGERFVRFTRSSGASRVGNCLFVLEALADKMKKWMFCGLDIKEGEPIDLAAFESYISLSASSIIDTITIKPEEILIIDDYTSEFEDDVIAVSAPHDILVAEKKRGIIKNSIWDGQSLADKSLFEKFPNKGMMVLRNKFFKTAAFNCNIQQWFKDNNITSVSQLKGFTLAKDISQIKLITTPNSVKYLKFGKIEDWLKNIEPEFGVVKTDKPTKFFNGRMVAAHYQLINTLALSKEEVKKLLEPSLKYLELIRSDIDVLRHRIGLTLGEERKPLKTAPLLNRNEIVFKMLTINKKFAQTKYYKEFRRNLLRSIVHSLKRGRILLPGTYAVLFGNPLSMLKATIGLFDGNSEFEKATLHCKFFKDGEKLLCSRSPHITMGNILLATNRINECIDRYFNLTSEIVCVNAIGENIQQRLNGSDYDSDAVLITNHPLLVSVAERGYNKFLVPTSLIAAKKIRRVYSAEDKADLDIKTSVNKIGEIVNLSQQLNSLFWHRVYNGESIDDLQELYLDISSLAVLSNVEIDRAKKEIQINSVREIKRFSDKYKMFDDGNVVKSAFLKTISIDNGYKPNKNIKYTPFHTPMDYVQEIIDEENLRQSREQKTKTIPFVDIIKKPSGSPKGGSPYYRKNKALALINEAEKEISLIRMAISKLKENEKTERNVLLKRINDKMQECIEKILKFDWCEHSLYLLLKEIDNKKYTSFATPLIDILFQTPNELFFGLLRRSADTLFDLVEDKDGDIQIYDFKFRKVKSRLNA